MPCEPVYDADTFHWYGLKFPDLDTPHWLPFLDAEVIGMEPDHKLTVPLPTKTGEPDIKPAA